MAEETLKARYFDERENLNRELNMYKNAAPLGVNVRKSATFLKDELEKDAIIFSLRERVANAEAGAGIREKEYQAEIEKLRAENRQLIVELKRIASEVNGKEKDQLEAALSESKRCAEECASLRAKLLWYAENQEIIDKGSGC